MIPLSHGGIISKCRTDQPVAWCGLEVIPNVIAKCRPSRHSMQPRGYFQLRCPSWPTSRSMQPSCDRWKSSGNEVIPIGDNRAVWMARVNRNICPYPDFSASRKTTSCQTRIFSPAGLAEVYMKECGSVQARLRHDLGRSGFHWQDWRSGGKKANEPRGMDV